MPTALERAIAGFRRRADDGGDTRGRISAAEYARMLIDRDAAGDRDKAFRLLTEAIAMYRDIGMPKHLEMAEALLEEV